MLNFIAELLRDEMRRHPHMFALMLLLSAGILGYSYRVFAQQTDVDSKFEQLTLISRERTQAADERFENLETRIGQVEQTIDQRFYEQRLATIDTEIFQLERLSESGAATERDLSRLNNLMIERGEVIRKLDEISRGIYR